LRHGSKLFDTVTSDLRAGGSPLLITGRLRRMATSDNAGTVRHETIQVTYGRSRTRKTHRDGFFTDRICEGRSFLGHSKIAG
jgi:hypothetical protein